MKSPLHTSAGNLSMALALILAPSSLQAQQLTPWMLNVGDGPVDLPKGVKSRNGADRLPLVYDHDKMPPEKPSQDQPQWALAPLGADGKINYGSGTSSIIPKAKYNQFTTVDYTYFRAYLDLRNFTKDQIQEVKLVIGSVDDQARVKIYNSQHLAGSYVEGSDGKRGGTNFTTYFKNQEVDMLVAGEVNTFVIIQVDDNPGGNLLTGGITVLMNGAELKPDPKPLPAKAEGYAEIKVNLIGSAKAVEGQPQEYSLTPDEIGTKLDADGNPGNGGAVWTTSKLDLSRNFTLKAEINFGDKDALGADGIALVIQQSTNSEMGLGAGLGYQGLSPSYVVEFDTYSNKDFNDPVEDHVGARGHGIAQHDTSTADDFKTVDNLEDGKWHPLEFTWNAAAKTFDLTLDSKEVFKAKSFPEGGALTEGYFGFTATTGGLTNKQSVRNIVLVDES